MPTLLVFGVRHLGRTIAREFAREGWSAAGVARSDETVVSFREELPGALGIVADASREEEVERAFAETRARFGPVDLVVVAIFPYGMGMLPAIRNVLRIGGRELGAAGAGTIVQIGAGWAQRRTPGRLPWAASSVRAALSRRSVGVWNRGLGGRGGKLSPERIEHYWLHHGHRGFVTRTLVHSAAGKLREQGVHVALLIVAGTIESPKTAELLDGSAPDASVSEEEVARAVAFLAAQSSRAWSHELVLTPRLARWVP
jgi:NAD(P)-dependent dehydrogenase (short-subunit alcohol dehydrogenase family)